MYIHIGNEKIVGENEIIGIFDIETTTTSQISREFLKKAEESGNIIEISLDIPKSYVLCGTADYIKVYLAPVAASTIRKRSKLIF